MVASGSGFGYLLDVLGTLAYKIEKSEDYRVPSIEVYYTVRCAAFCKQFKEEIESLLKIIEIKQTARVNFHWVVTNDEYNDRRKEERYGTETGPIKTLKGKLPLREPIETV